MVKQVLIDHVDVIELIEKIADLIEIKLSQQLSQGKDNLSSEFLTRTEVAALLKISLPTLHEWTKSKLLQSYKIGNKVLYKRIEVEESLHKTYSLKYKRGGGKNAA